MINKKKKTLKSNNVGEDAVKWICSKCVEKSMHGMLDLDTEKIEESDENNII
jgi:hypothetical protein